MALLRQKPRLFPVLFISSAVILCTALGIWQLQRRTWKHDLIHRIDTRTHEAPVPLPAQIDNPDDWDYRHVTVTGTFRNDKESYLLAQSRNGNFGYEVITPLERPGAVDVLVNRGWIPYEKRDPATRPQGQITGQVTITGLARLPWHQTWLAHQVVPDNDLVKKVFFEGALEQMAAAQGIKAAPVFVDADATPNPGGLPIGGQTVVKLNDPHLSYAIQWFSLAIAALVIFVVYHRRKDE